MSDEMRQVTVKANVRDRTVHVRIVPGQVVRTAVLDEDISVEYLSDGTIGGIRIRFARWGGEALPIGRTLPKPPPGGEDRRPYSAEI